jgi:hypothetical protein
VLDKDRRNFCDFFSTARGKRAADKKAAAPDARSRLDALFKK